MILLDCGNSTIKAQFFVNGVVQASFASSYHPRWPQSLGAWLALHQAVHCYVCSVLDVPRKGLLVDCLNQYSNASVTWLKSQAQGPGLINGYLQPERLGVDRWIAMLAAVGETSVNRVVIDAGSAITIDFIRADGQHLGGAILPGINTSLQSFKRIFSHIDFSDAQIAQKDRPGCSTEAAIQIDYASSPGAAVVALVDDWGQVFEGKVDILITGGDAQIIRALLDRPARILPDLIFRGMLRIVNSQ